METLNFSCQVSAHSHKMIKSCWSNAWSQVFLISLYTMLTSAKWRFVDWICSVILLTYNKNYTVPILSLGVHQNAQVNDWSDCHLQTSLGSDCLRTSRSMLQSFHKFHNYQVLVTYKNYASSFGRLDDEFSQV